MNRRRLVIAFGLVLVASLVAEFVYLTIKAKADRRSQAAKIAAVTLTGLPDLALSTEARFIRHRSLSGIDAILNEGGSLSEYFPSGFVYALPKSAHAAGVMTYER